MTIPITRGERPRARTGARSAIKVAAAAKIATKKTPKRVPLRFDGENGTLLPLF